MQARPHVCELTRLLKQLATSQRRTTPSSNHVADAPASTTLVATYPLPHTHCHVSPTYCTPRAHPFQLNSGGCFIAPPCMYTLSHLLGLPGLPGCGPHLPDASRSQQVHKRAPPCTWMHHISHHTAITAALLFIITCITISPASDLCKFQLGQVEIPLALSPSWPPFILACTPSTRTLCKSPPPCTSWLEQPPCCLGLLPSAVSCSLSSGPGA